VPEQQLANTITEVITIEIDVNENTVIHIISHNLQKLQHSRSSPERKTPPKCETSYKTHSTHAQGAAKLNKTISLIHTWPVATCLNSVVLQ
jgi:hypothetical protein